MKPTSYTFFFKGGPITVQAYNNEQAKILAQAEAIKRGWDYTTLSKAPQTLKYFLWHKTNALELCVIRENGWIKATCYIDHEDLFLIPPEFANKSVKNEEWDVLNIIDHNGKAVQIPCHYIDI